MRKGDKQLTDYSLNSLKLVNVGEKLHFEVDTDGTLMDSLVAFWKLDEVGNGRHDVLGKNHLTDNNRVSAAEGKKGNAGHFTSSRSQYLSIPDNDDLSIGDFDWTLACWVYFDTLPGGSGGGIISKTDAAQHEYDLVYIGGATNKFRWRIFNSAQSLVQVTADNFGAASTATWYFMVAWHDAANDLVGIQINDTTENTAATSGLVPWDGGKPFEFGRFSGDANYLNGRVDDVGFWKKVLTSQERTDLYNSGNGNTVTGGDWPLEQFNTDSSGELLRDLVAYWKLDENIPASAAATTRYDSVGLNHLTDNATVTEAGGIRGQAGQFTSANSEYLSVADNADISVGDIDFTWAAWVYRDAAGVTQTVLAQGNNDLDSSYKLAILASNVARFSVFDTGNVENVADSTSTLAANQWYFLVGWHDSVANTLNIQIDNGTPVSAAYTGGGRDVATALNIGRHGTSATHMNGRIDEVGFWKRVLTSAEKTDLYNSGAGQTITDNNKTNNKRFRVDTNGTLMLDLKAYWKLDENAGTRYDEVGENNLTDIATVTQAYGIKSFAGQFVRANNEYLRAQDNPDLSTGNIDFTVACWVYLDSKPAANMHFYSRWDGSTNEFNLNWNQADVFKFDVGSGAVQADSFGAASTGTWYFIVAWHDASADTINIQVSNGTVDSAAHTTGNTEGDSPLILGSLNDTPAGLFDGRIDEVGFWKKVLTSQERTDLYNGGVGNTVVKDQIL